MGFADMAAYALVLAHIGPVAMAVTSALNYQFLRPCRPGPLFADAFMLRLGKRLAVMDVRIWTDDADRPVGQANVTYAIPSDRAEVGFRPVAEKPPYQSRSCRAKLRPPEGEPFRWASRLPIGSAH